ncbi:site-specific integrase [Acidovorax sp. sic0104]|uniref:tyrosine-type recombinase/integrase n=1 Tax=Acidovorax sp. sic0104 TaxID=2854784 RepID=UPI001C467EBF|nr:site-specific integrase [Acidovorax sp. sic0104]MBV7541955.1 site-specific integrase [Acidovorax sp. sic0104]
MSIPATRVHVVPVENEPLPATVVSPYVQDDLTAIGIFLATYSRKSRHTIRSYKKEVYRFLLWLRRRRPPGDALLPDVELADINAYVAFLDNPQPFDEDFLRSQGWKHQPFRKRLEAESVTHCLTVLHKLFRTMREMKRSRKEVYCLTNPVEISYGVNKSKKNEEPIEQALTEEELEIVLQVIESLPRETERELKHYHRARWIVQLLYRAFLRREEAANLRMSNFEPVRDGWVVRVHGKGDIEKVIVATKKLMQELGVYRMSMGLSPVPGPDEDTPAILAVTGKNKGVTDQVVYLVCRELFQQAVEVVKGTDPWTARRLAAATTHWYRHTGISHAMERGVGPRYVQSQARHSSLLVTARYDHKNSVAWRKAFEDSDKNG